MDATMSLVRSTVRGGWMSMLAMLATWALATFAFGETWDVAPMGGEVMQIPLFLFIIATVVSCVGAYLVALLLSRWNNAARNWLIVCAVVLILEAFNANSAAQFTSTSIWLNVAHIAVALGVGSQLYIALNAPKGVKEEVAE